MNPCANLTLVTRFRFEGARFLSQLWSRLGRNEPGAMKNLWSEIEKLPVPEGRINPWSVEQFAHMMKTADAEGRPETADSFVLGAFTASRQADRLQWTLLEDTGTHIEGRQQKTGKLVSILKLPIVTRRFAAAQARRKAMKVQWLHLLIDAPPAASPPSRATSSPAPPPCRRNTMWPKTAASPTPQSSCSAPGWRASCEANASQRPSPANPNRGPS
jgi:hypothetical protein